MVNGPVSGGEFPLGKEYWEKQAEDKGYEYDPNKNVPPPPKKVINVPVGQTQQGEAAYKEITKVDSLDVAKLLREAKIELKSVMFDHIERTDSDSMPLANSLKKARPATDMIKKLLSSIPAEDMAKLTTKKDILDYIIAHKQDFGLEEKPAQAEEIVPEETEEKPVISGKLPLEPIENSTIKPEETEEKPVISEKFQLEPPKNPYVEPDTEDK